jgi:hypothetical protein
MAVVMAIRMCVAMGHGFLAVATFSFRDEPVSSFFPIESINLTLVSGRSHVVSLMLATLGRDEHGANDIRCSSGNTILVGSLRRVLQSHLKNLGLSQRNLRGGLVREHHAGCTVLGVAVTDPSDNELVGRGVRPKGHPQHRCLELCNAVKGGPLDRPGQYLLQPRRFFSETRLTADFEKLLSRRQ